VEGKDIGGALFGRLNATALVETSIAKGPFDLLSADDPRNVLIKAQQTIGNNTIKVEQQKAAALGRGAGTTGRGNGTELPRV
jgi:hypothetical protein